MDRRSLLKAGTLAGLAALMSRPSLAATGAATGPVNVYTGSDANVSDFWTNEILPRFAKAHPEWTTRMVDAGDGAGLRALADRALAALASNTDPQVEMFEGFDALQTKGALEAGLWVDFAKAGLKNAGRMNPAAHQTDFDLAYRGSQVLLAYDASRIKPEAAPKSWAALTTWIKANPGQFIYNRPDKGGSGGNFVRRAIHEANGRDPSKFTLANFTPDFAEASLAPAWKLLADLGPDLYEGGAYTSGNTQTLQMLGQGVVSMAPVWSDQVLQAIAQGVLPEDTGLVQLQDLALCGGFSRITVPVNAAQKEAALALADFLLSAEIQSLIITGLGGFPGVGWEHVDPGLKAKYADVIPASIPTFPAGPWDAAISDGWYRNVAPGVSRG